MVQQLAIFDDARNTVGVNDGLVPGGYAQRSIVPGGRDVSVRPLKNDQRFLLACKCAPLRVGASHVRLEHPIYAASGVKEEGHMGRKRGVVSSRYQRAKAMLAYERLQRCHIIFSKMLRDIHACTSLEVLM